MGLGVFADDMARGVESAFADLSQRFVEPSLRLGVTGLSRAGKTVFITSLVANLMNRGRMGQLRAAAAGRIETAFLQPQPDDTLPRFDYENHLAALTGPVPHWPDSTRAISELRLSFRLRPSGLLGGIAGPRRLHLDIVDYPGEWLLDLALLDKGYDAWADDALSLARTRAEAAPFLAALEAQNGAAALDETQAQHLAAAFTAYLAAARAAGYSDCTPGRFLMPGDLAGSPVLTFAPLPRPERARRGTLWYEMARRYDAYRRQVVRPFFRSHFARIDRQIVLVDVLGAIHSGPPAVEDMRRTLAGILGAFRPGRNSALRRLVHGKRVERILFAATKADHLHHSQHARLGAIMEALLREARDRADFAGAKTAAMAIASLRTTVEEEIERDGERLPCVRGRLASTGRQTVMYPGELPEDPSRLLVPARNGTQQWLDAEYQITGFAPAEITLRPGEGPPHIRLDRAAEFLIGDRL